MDQPARRPPHRRLGRRPARRHPAESHAGWYDDDVAFIRPWGFDLAAIEGPVHVWQGAHDRMVPFAHGQWLAAHIPTACVHLYEEHGHLSLAIDSLPRILDEMLSFEASTTRA